MYAFCSFFSKNICPAYYLFYLSPLHLVTFKYLLCFCLLQLRSSSLLFYKLQTSVFVGIVGEVQLHRFGHFLANYNHNLTSFRKKLPNNFQIRSSPLQLEVLLANFTTPTCLTSKWFLEYNIRRCYPLEAGPIGQ